MEFEDQLVQWAEDTVRSMRQRAKETIEKQAKKSGRTQVSKAIEVVKQARSLPVFYSWIRYQWARESESEKFWGLETGTGNKLAEHITTRVADIKRKLEETTDIDEATKRHKSIEATTRFLGYFRRALVAVEYIDQIPAALRGDEGQ